MGADGDRTAVGRPSDEDLRALSDSFESAGPEAVLAHALERYASRIVLACSFGAEDVVLLDMIQRIRPATPLLYLDTDFLFPETYALRDRIVERYRLRPEQILRVTSRLTPAQQAAEYGEALWAR